VAVARLIYSLWPGYLERGNQDIRDWCSDQGVHFEIQHTSGHAGITDLKRLVEALLPKKIVPIHSSATDRFQDYFADVEQKEDGRWWTI
jgi:ribonuclease J